jgi:sugar transferase (PEP-CTERM/EpsH1 system associated)
MKILVLDEEFPYPLNAGKRIRSFNLIKRLVGRHQVNYLAYGIEGSEAYEALADSGIHPIAVPPQVPPKSGLLFYPRLLANLFSRYPYIVSSHHSRIFRSAMEKAIERIRPDLIICEWTPYAVYVRNLSDVNRIVVAHNIECLIWRRYYENERNPVKKWYIKKQTIKLERFERDIFAHIEGATAVSNLEAETIRGFNSELDIQVVENGVDLEYFQPSTNPPAKNSLVFVGSMNWRPNQDAIQYFVEEIFPLIKSKRGDVTATFVGQDPPAHIKRLNQIPGIKIVGRVDDVRPYVLDGAVYIAPLRIGGGTRLKIIEALAMGKAVVSTRVGAEGLDLTDGENIILADAPERFADKIIFLLDNPDIAEKLGVTGRKLVESKYGWDTLAVKLERFLSEVNRKK